MSNDIQNQTNKLKEQQDYLNKIHYSSDALFGYNAMINFVVSGRGSGKSFEFKRKALKSKSQVMWIRRYDNDLPDVEESFMSDLYKEGYFLDDEIKIVNNHLIMNGETKIYFTGLNVSSKKKSVSYPDVDLIIFDEFIETNPRKSYLPKETETFLDIIETVNRLRVGRPEVRCFLLGNKVSFVNPYFSFFKIHTFNGRFKKFKKGLIVVENYSNKEFIELKKKSKFGQLIEGTRYSRYAIDNESFRDTMDFIKKRPSDSKLLCNIRYGDKYIGCWKFESKLYCSNEYNMSTITFALFDDLREREFSLKKNEVPMVWIKDLYSLGQLCFDDNIIKDIILGLIDECKR